MPFNIVEFFSFMPKKRQMRENNDEKKTIL